MDYREFDQVERVTGAETKEIHPWLELSGRESERPIASLFQTDFSKDSSGSIYQGRSADGTDAFGKLKVQVVVDRVGVGFYTIALILSLRGGEHDVYTDGGLNAAGIAAGIGDRVGDLVVPAIGSAKLSFGELPFLDAAVVGTALVNIFPLQGSLALDVEFDYIATFNFGCRLDFIHYRYGHLGR